MSLRAAAGSATGGGGGGGASGKTGLSRHGARAKVEENLRENDDDRARAAVCNLQSSKAVGASKYGCCHCQRALAALRDAE